MKTTFRLLVLSLVGISLLFAVATPVSAQKIKAGFWTSKRHLPTKDWCIVNTAHYQVQSAVGKEKGKRLANHMEKMLKVYKKIFPPMHSWGRQKPIKLLSGRRSYHAYGGPPGSAAYYSRWDAEMVCYDTGHWQDDAKLKDLDTLDFEAVKAKMAMDILGTAAHEGWHQYFAWYVKSQVSMPSWINEGMGDYFYAAIPKGSMRKPKAELGRMNAARLHLIQAAVRANKHVPVKKIVHYTQQQYYSNPGICYAEGWSLCCFMLHSKNKKYNKIVPTYVKTVRDTVMIERVFKKAFKGIDLDKLEADWKAWLLVQKLAEEDDTEALLKRAIANKKKNEGPTTGTGGKKKGQPKKPKTSSKTRG